MRVTVCAPSLEANFLDLPASRISHERPFPSGGERSLYELAVAAASLGHDVELRGDLNGPVLDPITAAAGVAPRIGLDPRPPECGEVVVLPDGIQVPDRYAGAFLSGARPVVLLLGPPGLCGWPFRSGWSLPDPATVAFGDVGTPAMFQAINALGFTLWTRTWGIAQAARQSGVPISCIGCGSPVPFPEATTKTHDVAIVEASRWRAAAEEVVRRLEGVSVLRIPPTASQYSLSGLLASARVLIWPSRIEGVSRVAREARGVGTVPVALRGNPFVSAEDVGQGVVLVDDLVELAEAVRKLLEDPERLQRLALAGKSGARSESDWELFRRRVSEAIDALAGVEPADEARSEFGAFIRGTRAEEVSVFREALDEHRAHLARHERRAADQDALIALRQQQLDAANETMSTELAQVRAAHDGVVSHLGELRDHNAMLAASNESHARALAASQAETEALRDGLGAAQQELDAFRSRRVVRLVDGTVVGRALARSRRRHTPG